MKPPKNFYSNLDRRKQGLPEVPEASAADVGKVIKVDESGAYELGNADALPTVTSDDAGKVLQVNERGKWVAAPFNPGAEVTPLNYFQLPHGNSSLLLGFKPTDCDEVIINYHTNGTPGSQMNVINTNQASWDTRRAVNIHYDNNSWYCCNNHIGSYQEGEFKFKFNMTNGKVYKDNSELMTFDNSELLNNYELKIGDMGGLAGSSNYGAYFKRIQGIKNNQLIHDLVPVKIGNNNYYFMDQITGLIIGGKDWTISTDTIGG